MGRSNFVSYTWDFLRAGVESTSSCTIIPSIWCNIDPTSLSLSRSHPSLSPREFGTFLWSSLGGRDMGVSSTSAGSFMCLYKQVCTITAFVPRVVPAPPRLTIVMLYFSSSPTIVDVRSLLVFMGKLGRDSSVFASLGTVFVFSLWRTTIAMFALVLRWRPLFLVRFVVLRRLCKDFSFLFSQSCLLHRDLPRRVLLWYLLLSLHLRGRRPILQRILHRV